MHSDPELTVSSVAEGHLIKTVVEENLTHFETLVVACPSPYHESVVSEESGQRGHGSPHIFEGNVTENATDCQDLRGREISIRVSGARIRGFHLDIRQVHALDGRTSALRERLVILNENRIHWPAGVLFRQDGQHITPFASAHGDKMNNSVFVIRGLGQCSTQIALDKFEPKRN
jgi:hypothetical protein